MAADVMMSKTRTRKIITKNIAQNASSPPILKCDPDGSEVLLVEMLLVRFSITKSPLYTPYKPYTQLHIINKMLHTLQLLMNGVLQPHTNY